MWRGENGFLSRANVLRKGRVALRTVGFIFARIAIDQVYHFINLALLKFLHARYLTSSPGHDLLKAGTKAIPLVKDPLQSVLKLC